MSSPESTSAPIGTSYSDLIFSEQANNNFSKTLGELRRSTLSIRNRLQSMQEDAIFAQSVGDLYRRPLIANERCGSWYVNPQYKAGSAYFKSTDGHTGFWKFSTRRLNLHLLELIGRNNGCVIVDSTRRGKRMPDALSKTIPIWCSILNRFLFPDLTQLHGLYTPPQVVSESEQDQMMALLPFFLASLRALELPVEELRSQLSKPLRPFWVTPDSQLLPTDNVFDDFHPIICCTVSRRVLGGEMSEGGYIQGAGDDTENWANGLTPIVFWANRQSLLSSSEDDLPHLIDMLVKDASLTSDRESITCIRPTSCLYITPTLAIRPSNTSTDACSIMLTNKVTAENTWQITPKRLEVGLGPHKVGSRNLRTALPTIAKFAAAQLLRKEDGSQSDIIISCETGKDLSVGVALALLCLFFDSSGTPLENLQDRAAAMNMRNFDKVFIRQRLGWISASIPDANPSRATLQSVNSFLMDRPI